MGNWLDQLNSSAGDFFPLDEESHKLIRFCLDLAEKTDGAFDPTIINALVGYGYDQTYSFQRGVAGPVGYQNVELLEGGIKLHNGVKIEFGTIGKGYLLDEMKKILDPFSRFIIDFGGDMFAKGGYEIGIENPFDLSQAIGTISVDGFAVAASNGKKRAHKDFHHLLDAQSGLPMNEIAGVAVAAESGLVADAMSTAIFVSGPEKGRKLLQNTAGVTGLMIFPDGRYWMKEGYGGKLFTVER